MHDILQKIELRQLLLIMGGLLLLLLTIFMTFFISPQYKEYQGILKSRDILKKVVVDNNDLVNQLQFEKKSVSQLNKKLHGDMASLPLNQIESYIIGRLQKISWQHNVELSGIRPTVGETVDSFQEVVFNVKLSGDYFDLYSWINELRKELGFTVIKQFEMRPQQQNKSTPRLLANLTMASYRGVQK